MSRKIKIAIFLLLIFGSVDSFAQNTDSLFLAFNNPKAHDTLRLQAIHKIADSFLRTKPDTALILYNKELTYAKKAKQKKYEALSLNKIGIIYYEQGDFLKALDYYNNSLKISEEIGNKIGVANAYSNIGNINSDQGKISDALDYYNKGLKAYEEIKDTAGITASLNNIGSIYRDQGDIVKALEYFYKSLKIREASGDKKGVATCLHKIAIVYYNQGDLPKALNYYFKSLKTREEIKDKSGVANSLNNIGLIYNQQHDTTKALECYRQSLKIHEELGNKSGVATTLSNIGIVCYNQGDLSRAIEYYYKSLKIYEEIGDKNGSALVHNKIGSIYLEQKNYTSALDHLQKSISISKEIGYPERINEAAKKLFELYKKTGNTKLALENFELYVRMRDSLQSKENTKATIQQQFKYEYEKKAAADSIKVSEEKKVVAAKFKQEQTQRYALYGGLALVALFGAFMFNRFKVTQKQKNIIEIKEKQTQEQNVVIVQQKHLIEERHKEITDSINYAERIQRSFLATKELLDANLHEYFILFKPKDIVSGDFYWAATLNNKQFALVTADSTGHGVPGAIMSLLNITSLEKAIEQHTHPAEILNSTRKTIIDRLKKDGSVEGGKDGMDCSLCVFDFATMKLYVAAANNPVWIVRGSKVTEIKPDKMPVGKHDKQDITFTQHEISLQKGDVIYTLTDGFPDQFGGEKGKKFMIKNLRELLVNNVGLSMEEQKTLLEKTFRDWVGDIEQVDDVTVIGIRI